MTVWLVAFDGEEVVEVGSGEPVVPGEGEDGEVGDVLAAGADCHVATAPEPLDRVGMPDGDDEGPGATEGICPGVLVPVPIAPFP